METLSGFAARAALILLDDPAHLKAYVAQLEQELSQLREAVSPLGLVQLDGQSGRFLSANHAFCSFVGYSEVELCRCTAAELIHPSDFDPQAHLRAVNSRPVFQDKRFITRDGRVVWASVATTYLHDPQGRLIATGVVKDITPRKEALAQAAEANRFLSGVLEASTQGIISVDESGKITLVNLGAESIFGYSREELIGQRVEVLLPERFRQVHPGYQRSYFREPRNRPMGHGSELIGRRKDGSEFPAEITLSHVSTEHGPTATVFVSDITERKRREGALRESEESLRVLLERSSGGVAIFDREMRYRFSNQQWRNDYGLAEDIVGRSHYELFPEIPESWKQVHQRALAGESIKADEDPFDRADGTRQWVKWEVLP